MTQETQIHPVILSGGRGTRLWPLSRSLHPKQLHALNSERTMIQETALRFGGRPEFTDPMVICNEEHRFVIAEQMREIEIEAGDIVLEPVGRNTAPAIATAALLIHERDPEAILLVLPADHIIADEEAFLSATAAGALCANKGNLVTFGVLPTGPETGYGYIEKGDKITGSDGFKVDRFTEKPDEARANEFFTSGKYLWNAGIFMFSAARILEATARHAPDVLESCRCAVAEARHDLDFLRLGRKAFAAGPSISIDYAVMEQASDVVVVPVDMGWNDIGAWQALWSVGEHDERGNVLVGDVIAEDTHDSYIRSEQRLVATAGLRDMVVVETSDAILVARKDAAKQTQEIVARLEKEGRTQHEHHARVFRPWGWYEALDSGDGYQVKHIMVKPGASLSLQRHRRRAEHWIVIAGTATVTRGADTFTLNRNESTFIPLETKHRLSNDADTTLNIIEVQSGEYLGEDDIERFDDEYGRHRNDTN